MEEDSQATVGRIVEAAITCVGADFVRVNPDLATRINGQTKPLVSVHPGHEQEVSAVLQAASANGWTVAVIGGGSQLDFGNIPQSIAIALHTDRLNQVVDYSPADMVVSVQSGMRFGDLQSLLAQHGQMLAIDPVCDAAVTVGGLAATGVSGPSRALYGTLRDMLIGARVVFADGDVVRTGGKVVKNVAGYDLSKMLIGSLGTLGVLTECTFKLKPLPLHRELCVIGGLAGQMDDVRKWAMDSLLVPSCLELVSARQMESLSADREPWALLIGCDESERAAASQTEHLRQLAANAGASFSVLRGAQEVESFWRRQRERLRPAGLVLRMQGPPRDLVAMAAEIEVFATTQGFANLYSFSLSSGSGYVFVSTVDLERQQGFVSEVRRICAKRDIASVIERAPLEVRRRHDVFSSSRLGDAELSVMRSVKQAFDPGGILSPMKFAGGI